MISISIELVLLILIAVIMFFSILTGLCQGFRKNMFKLVATIIFWIIFWVTAPLVKGKFFWYNEEFYQLLAPMFNGTQYANLMEFILANIANAIGMDPATLADPAIENTFIAVAMCIIKIVYLIILALVYGVVKSIVYKVRFKYYCKINRKVVRKLEKKQKRFVKKNGRKDLKIELELEKKRAALKKNKIYRPLGMVSGLARGFLTSFLILCIINSTVRLLPENNKQDDVTASTNSYESTPSIYDFILEFTGNDPIVAEAVSMINEYQSSTLMNITGIKIGARTADELFIDSILSGKSEDYSFAIRKELQSIIKIAEEAFYLTNGFDMESVNWLALNNAQVESIQKILTILSDDDLINNLGSVMVGIAISLEAVAPYMPENLSEEEYKNIDWGGELTTIAELVASVYSLGDLSQLNYLELDETVVEDIIVTLSELESINFLGHVGANLGIKTLVGDNEEYAETIEKIEQKLADLAVNNGYSDTIYAYKDLYADFIEIFESDALNQYKDENGNITNYVSALTSVDTEKYSNIVSTVLEANFVNEVLPDVLTIVKEELIPEEYSSLINPGIVTTSQWENEINAAFTIINSITDKGAHPFDTIETFDFALLSNFSTETVVESELLSYAMIKIFIDTSKEEGILASSVEGIGNFVSVPDALTAPADDKHRFAAKWYGSETLNYEDGELFIMLDTVKNCAAQLENLNNPEKSLPAILATIDGNKIVSSDVLYYSLNKMVDQVNQFIIVPVNETSRSLDTVNGQYVERMIKKESLKEVLNVFTDSNIVDLEGLLSYYEVFPDGTVAEEATPKDQIEYVEDYQAKFDMSTENILGLLTSKKLYNPETGDEENLNKLFNSQILRATVSNLLNEFAGEYVAIPNRSSTDVQCYVLSGEEGDENREVVAENVKVVNKKDFKSLIMAVNDLDLDLASMMDDPMGVIDSLKDENGLKDEAKAIFEDANSSKYSGILHATISKYVIEFSEEGGEGLAIVVPEEVLDSDDSSLISCSETVNLLESLIIIGTDVLTDSEMSDEEMMNSVINNVINNDKSLNSTIIRATLTNFIDSEETGLTIPNEALEANFAKKVATKQSVNDLLTAIKTMKDVKNETLPENEQIDYYDLLDVENIDVSMLSKADAKPNNPISNSLILRGIVTDQLEQNEIVVPSEAKDGSVISKQESIALISALCDVLGEDSTITNINIDDLTVGEFVDAKDKIKASKVIRKLVTDELEKQEDIVVPSLSLDDNITSTEVLSENEVSNLIEGLGKVLNTTDKITSINIDNITTAKLSNAKGNIKSSYVLNATIANALSKQDDVAVPEDAYENENEKILEANEIDHLVDGLVNLLGQNASVSNINIDDIKASDIRNAKANIQNSKILNATITVQLDNQADVIVPSEAYNDAEADVKTIESEEIGQLVDGLVNLLGEDAQVSSINIDDIKTKNMSDAKANVQASLILNATITNQLDEQEDVIVPEGSYVDADAEIKVLKSAEIGNLIDGLVNLLGEDAQVSSINIDNIKAKNMSDAKANVQASLILNATITNQLDEQNDVIVPEGSYVDADADIKVLKSVEIGNLIDGLVNLLGEEAQVSSINIDDIKAKNMSDAKANIQASSILNATITNQLDQQNDVVVPAYAYKDDEATNKELDSDEVGFLIDGLVSLLGEEAQVSNIDVESIKAKDMKNAKEEIESSSVLRATITNKLIEQESVVVPEEAYESAEAEIKVIESSEMGQIIDGLYNLLGEGAVMANVDIDSIKAKDMQNAKNNIKDSYVLNATITKQLDDQPSVLVPLEAYAETTGEDNMLLPTQMGELIDGIVNLLGEETSVNSISVDSVTTGDILSSKDNVKKSLVLNATITDKLQEQDAIKVPSSSYVDDEASIKVLTDDEVEYFITGLVTILGENENVNNIRVDNISVGKINEAKTNIQGSLILNATIANQLESNSEVATPDSAFDEITTSYKLLSSGELDNLITGLNNLLGSETKINAIQVSNITINKINSAKQQIADSHVLNATITKQIDNQSQNLVVPSKTYVDDTEDVKELESEQMVSLLSGIHNLLPANSPVNDIDVSGLTLAKVSGAREEIKASYILRATITKHIDSNESVVVPNVSLDEAISETNKNALKENEVDALIDTMISLFNENQKINELEVDTLTIGKLNSRYEVGHEKEGQLILSNSYVLKATVTKNLKDKEGDVLLIPSKSYDEYNILTNNEMDKVFASLDIIFGETRISAMNSFSNINISTINDNSEVLADSYVIRGTISKELLSTNDVTIPVGSIDNNVTDYDLLTKDELKKFFAAIDTMGIEDISNINASSLNVNKEKTATLAASDVMRATITKNVKVNNNAVYALRSDVDVTKDAKGNDILVLNQAQVTNMINSLNVLAPNGSINVQLNLTTLSTLDEQDLDTLLSSNSIRLEVSKLILAINPIIEHSKVDVYELPNNVDVNQEQKDIIEADVIKTFINSLV